MQIVIDIPKSCYDDVCSYETVSMVTIYNAIRVGDVLPKNHGRLIDADELKKHKYYDIDSYESAVSVVQIDRQPTVIEADKKGI